MKYDTMVFDCDGVVLNSNRVKTDAFYRSVIDYGEACAKEFVNYHLANGGVSRYKKFEYFLNSIVCGRKKGPSLSVLLKKYSDYVSDGLASCEVEPDLSALRNKFDRTKWLLVSGGDQEELRSVFSARGLSGFFDGGIFGSPDDKVTIFRRERSCFNISDNSVYFGDSRYDHIAAVEGGLDFVFVSQWSEFSDWKSYCLKNGVETIPSLRRALDF
ncbi:HAD family hydrolase [Azonexus sp.]|uniref:HAD family hydrolase n=1 Tax=Azonexus sp. TaxID=1872668 RepID=UPI0035B40F5B